MPLTWWWPARGHWAPGCGRWPSQALGRSRHSPSLVLEREEPVCNHPAAEARPRCGVALAGVTRLQATRVPRPRPAPDGRTEGGPQSTDSSRLNRRMLLAPSLPMDNRTQRPASNEEKGERISTQSLTSEVIATPRVRRGWKPARRRSVGFWQSDAGLGSARCSISPLLT